MSTTRTRGGKKDKIVTFRKIMWAYYKTELGKEVAENMLIEECFKKGYVPMRPFQHTPVELTVDDWRVSCLCGYAGKKAAREFGVVERPSGPFYFPAPKSKLKV